MKSVAVLHRPVHACVRRDHVVTWPAPGLSRQRAQLNRDGDGAVEALQGDLAAEDLERTSIGGDTVPPDTATRIGCATLPRPTPPSSATACTNWCSSGAVQSASAPCGRAPAAAAARLGRQVLLRRLLVVAGDVAEEEPAGRRHLLQRPGPLPLGLRNHGDLGQVVGHCRSRPIAA